MERPTIHNSFGAFAYELAELSPKDLQDLLPVYYIQLDTLLKKQFYLWMNFDPSRDDLQEDYGPILINSLSFSLKALLGTNTFECQLLNSLRIYAETKSIKKWLRRLEQFDNNEITLNQLNAQTSRLVDAYVVERLLLYAGRIGFLIFVDNFYDSILNYQLLKAQVNQSFDKRFIQLSYVPSYNFATGNLYLGNCRIEPDQRFDNHDYHTSISKTTKFFSKTNTPGVSNSNLIKFLSK